MGEVVIGVDAHKRSHTLVAVDEVGRKLGERVVDATSEGHLQALAWASRWDRVRSRWRTAGMSPAGSRVT
jgi:hypothetical protein